MSTSPLVPGRRVRIWLVRIAVLAMVIASATTVATSVQRTRRADEAIRVAQVRAAAKRTATAEGRADLDRLSRSRTDAERRSDRDATDASSIDDSVALLAQMRTELATVEQDVTRSREANDALGGRLDVLRGCRRIIDAASSSYGGGSEQAAAMLLESGRATCTDAVAGAGSANPPAHPYDFPDPHVITVGDTFFAYGTNGPTGNIQVLSSTDLRTWAINGEALAGVPLWAQPGRTWAPSVTAMGGRYVLHYTVRSSGSGRQCISAAVSDSPTGPFIDDSLVPVVCQDGLGGSIDPSTHQDEFGFWHLTWKSEDETVGGTAKLWTQYLAADGRSLEGPAAVLLDGAAGWEGQTIENPSMAKLGDQWVLLYSGNRWDQGAYAMGYALCETAQGPCQRPSTDAVLSSGGGLEGPGGGQFFRTPDGQWKVAFAAWDAGRTGYPNSRRLHVASVDLGAFGLVLA